MTVHMTMESPLGALLLVGEESATAGGGAALASVSMTGQRNAAVVRPGWRRDPEAFAEIVRQFRAYFDDAATAGFDLELSSGGTAFQQRVWRAVDAIPSGATVSYGELARRIGAPRTAVRAVGTAVGANPLLVVRPCHRVVGADGALTGYAGGLDRKRYLLRHEGAHEGAHHG
ncbi:methylated-DNA--[protein]-cysteine S-methyltransferase [Streptacidiphilus sp. PB12-B1b]|uniref:methylated-DNA--[protein]-cysteine S-methyltransferase n=1 Tax=Streptacidiphilus sp. PB12-B1b TaxID=2705012 RepID=UPI0015F93212|nr:methylated-DNA--[protein]-cysteine S-methyltransferase [Streptacidiphilus sp. PB12-B1b]QMU75656.1 methylated-DNA--[protein]-cysteine S-methyltransferase [Streptacidiphilus sp. PB12-B1b]